MLACARGWVGHTPPPPPAPLPPAQQPPCQRPCSGQTALTAFTIEHCLATSRWSNDEHYRSLCKGEGGNTNPPPPPCSRHYTRRKGTSSTEIAMKVVEGSCDWSISGGSTPDLCGPTPSPSPPTHITAPNLCPALCDVLFATLPHDWVCIEGGEHWAQREGCAAAAHWQPSEPPGPNAAMYAVLLQSTEHQVLYAEALPS